MDISKMRVLLQGAAKIFKAGQRSKTWDIHGMPQFITTMHRERCDMCEAYALHVVEVSKVLMVEILSREVEKALQIAWLNIIHHIEDKASSESDKKVKWCSNCHDNLTNDVRMVENKVSAERDHCPKADKKLAQANLQIEELGVLQMQDKRMPVDRGDLYNFSGSDSETTSGRSSQKRKKGQAFPPSISYGGFFPDNACTPIPVKALMLASLASVSTSAVGLIATLLTGHLPTSRTVPPWGKGDPPHFGNRNVT